VPLPADILNASTDEYQHRLADISTAGAVRMTHENIPNTEHDDGPEHDMALPDAGSIATFGTPEESDLPALTEDLGD
jgi:hypothetical protein